MACSRDPEVLKDLDAVIDVGGEYDSSRHRYDHHQRGFDEVFGHGFSTKLSSAGLVYKHFGLEVIASAALPAFCKANTARTPDCMQSNTLTFPLG
jgi:uncharacterized UPF0160 family protein